MDMFRILLAKSNTRDSGDLKGVCAETFLIDRVLSHVLPLDVVELSSASIRERPQTTKTTLILHIAAHGTSDGVLINGDSNSCIMTLDDLGQFVTYHSPELLVLAIGDQGLQFGRELAGATIPHVIVM